MSQNDLELNREVRKVLVRHWIDLGRLSFRSVNGRVWIKGDLYRIAGVKEQLTPTLVETIFAEISRLKKVVGLNVELNNWVQVEGRWKPLEEREKPGGLIIPPQPSAPTVHKLDTDS